MKKYFIRSTVLLLAALCLAIAVPALAGADSLLTPEILERAQCRNGGPCSLDVFMLVAVQVANIILGIVGALALLMFIYGGFTMLMSAGKSEQVTKGKQILVGSAVGLLIVFGSYAIIDFVVNTVLLQGQKSEFSFDGTSELDDGGTQSVSGSCPAQGGSCIQATDRCERVLWDNSKVPGQILNAKPSCGGGGSCCKLPILTCAQRGQGYRCINGSSCGLGFSPVGVAGFGACPLDSNTGVPGWCCKPNSTVIEE